MGRLHLALTIPLIAALLGGCGPEPCMDGDGIWPGQGVSIGGAPLCVGATPAAVTEQLGSPDSSGDLGALGMRFAHPSLSLSGFYAADGGPVTSLTVTDGYEGRTEGGTGIGSAEADVRADLGEPLVDPFGGAWVYQDQGIALQWQDGEVASIQVFDPTSM